MRIRNDKAIRVLVLLLCLLPLMALAGGHGAPAKGGEGGEGGEGGAAFPGYLALQPALVINLASARRAQFLRVDMQFFIETNEDAAAINLHMPAIRDRLIKLLGGRKADQISSPEAREQLRAELLAKLRELMTEKAKTPAITALYFTGFIIQ
jgi:flagellar protein FliL